VPDSFQFTNFVRRISRHGLLGSVRLIPVNLWFLLNALKPAAIAARQRERALDRELGINTAGDVPGGATAAEFGISADIYPYQAVVREDFAEMIGALPQDVSSFCFIDIGSGKGRALVLAARHPFAEVIGVELSARLHRIAEKNIAKVEPSLRCRVKLINQDARQFVFPIMPTVIFLFNPFGEEVMREVVRNIERTYGDSSLPIYFLYLWPFQAKVIIESKMWREISHGPHWKLFRLGTLRTL
jgi:SAM-dependent methyltransferase